MSSLFKRSSRDKDRKDVRTPKSRVSSGSSSFSVNVHGPNASPSTLNAPQQVIQATSAHIANASGELSFKTGDFFYVLSSADVSEQWIEAHDPVKNVRGRVPTKHFKFFDKTHKPDQKEPKSLRSSGVSSSSSPAAVAAASAAATNTATTTPASSPSVRKVSPLPSLYGRLLYDFKAERQDELNVAAGDSIIICAHHDYEWFIGKFFDKIGEPGLVPVSYVQLFDVTTKVPYSAPARQVIDSERLPTVDEWKAIKNRHKASARAVGAAASTPTGGANGAVSARSSSRSLDTAPVYALDVNIESFSSTSGKYWYLVRVLLNNGIVRSLCRYYEDFFNFHQNMLSTWPREGGRFDTKERKERIIPFIPGPLMEVSESLCHKRLVDLDIYLKGTIQLPEYISRTTLANSFFELLEGDQEFTSQDALQKVPIQPLRAPPNMIILNKSEGSSTSTSSTSPGVASVASAASAAGAATRHSQYQQDRMSQYETPKTSSVSNGLAGLHITPQQRRLSSVSSSSSSIKIHQTSTNGTTASSVSPTKLKLKFYYKDDIFAIVVADNISLSNLRKLIVPRIDESNDLNAERRVKLIPKNSRNVDDSMYEEADEIRTDGDLWGSSNFNDKGKFLVVVGEQS